VDHGAPDDGLVFYYRYLGIVRNGVLDTTYADPDHRVRRGRWTLTWVVMPDPETDDPNVGST
jgi:hypothetical protein